MNALQHVQVRFAVSRPSASAALLARARDVTALREAGRPTVPTTIAQELDTNPFLLAASVEEFAELRKAKDQF